MCLIQEDDRRVIAIMYYHGTGLRRNVYVCWGCGESGPRRPERRARRFLLHAPRRSNVVALFSATAICPSRRRAWRLEIGALYYRAAQTPGALAPRGGGWYSRCEERFCGILRRFLHREDRNPPGRANVSARVSWRRAHFAATWTEGGDVYQKYQIGSAKDLSNCSPPNMTIPFSTAPIGRVFGEPSRRRRRWRPRDRLQTRHFPPKTRHPEGGGRSERRRGRGRAIISVETRAGELLEGRLAWEFQLVEIARRHRPCSGGIGRSSRRLPRTVRDSATGSSARDANPRGERNRDSRRRRDCRGRCHRA